MAVALGIASVAVLADALPQQLSTLEVALDQALEEVRPDYAERLTLVDHAKHMLTQHEQFNLALPIKVQLVEAMANFRLGNVDRSTELVHGQCEKITADQFPALWFRCRSLEAILMLINGDRQASLQAYRALFANDLSAIPTRLVARAQVNYAISLNENGRAAEAADLYDHLMVDALENQDDKLSLYVGNNLVVILITQGDHLAARETLDKLKPILARNPNSLVKGSLRLHDLELSRAAGDVDLAINGLQAFIDNGEETTPLMVGSAHKLLADALRDAGRLDEALAEAHRAIDMLQKHVHEHTEARLALAQILLNQGNYSAVLKEISKVSLSQEAVPARRVQLHRMRLEAMLKQSGEPEELATFEALIEADRRKDSLASTTRSEYFQARLVATQRGLELKQAEALAAAALEKNRIDRRNRNLSLSLMAAATLSICLMVFLQMKRQSEHRTLLTERQHNEELELLIAEKTRELTANLNARAEMERAMERTRRTEAIGMLAGNVAHDFNNLLQVIASASEVLTDPTTTPEGKEKTIALQKRSLAHASRIIGQLLAFSRQQDLAAKPLKFRVYLNDSQALLQTALGERNVMKIEDDTDGANILVDTAQLTTSLLNLIKNSADAMPNGGEVTLSAKAVELTAQQALQWTDIEAGSYVLIGLKDTGIGMTDQQVARAHEPFFTTKSAKSGTGLGLSSVYGFVKQSGGDLKILSTPETGTLVQFLLPVTTLAEQESQPSDLAQGPELSRRRVLLVEDNEAVAMMLESLLKNLQLHTVRTASGETAQSYLLEDSNFDFVLSDVRMPGKLDGPALARWVQSTYPQIRVLLMSGFSELGPEDVDLPLIRKPFSLDELTQFIIRNTDPEATDSVT